MKFCNNLIYIENIEKQKKQVQKIGVLISKEIFCCKKVIHKVIHNFKRHLAMMNIRFQIGV